jgi:hypothetical protein
MYAVERKYFRHFQELWGIYAMEAEFKKNVKRLRHFEKIFRIYALRGDTFEKKSVCT